MQEAVLALLAKEPSHGYELRARIQRALGSLGDGMNAGQIYVTLNRLEKGGFLKSHPLPDESERSDRKVYALTPTGHERVNAWLADVDWQHLVPVQFHLKLVAVAAAQLADPIAVVDAQRRELLRRLADTQRAALAESNPTASLLLEGVVLRLQADLQWLEACERTWITERRLDDRYQ